MSTLATLALAVALLALTARIGRSRRDYGQDAQPPAPERARRRSGRVFFGCWRIA